MMNTTCSGPTRIVALDTETTGVDPYHDRIIELAFADVSEQGIASSWRRHRFNPGVPIPASASRVHGIFDPDVAHEPPFAVHAEAIQTRLQGAVVVAYNGLAFDLPLLDTELRRAGQPGLAPDTPVIDPYVIFREDTPRTLSDAARAYLGRAHNDAHQAEADASVMLDILRVQAARRGAPTIARLIHQSDRVPLTWGGHFYRSADDNCVRFGFGKHRDDVAQEHPDYLRWILCSDLPLPVKEAASMLLTTWAAEVLQ